MKKIAARVLSVIVFLTLLTICFVKVSDVVQRKDSDFKYKPFYEQKEDFDVLFMGTSHVINAVFPMELWADYGIVSYNFGGHGNMMPTTYWVMMNALDHTNPKLVVIDVLEVGKNDMVPGSAEQARLSLDSIPLSVTKYKAIQDLFGREPEEGQDNAATQGEKWEYLFDFGKYHTRWNDLKKEDFDKEHKTVEKGAEMRINVDIPDDYTLVPMDQKLEEDTVGMEYLRKMIEECQKRGIQVLLTHVPYPSTEEQQLSAHMVNSLADEYGIDYIDFVAMDNVVNYDIDCYDKHSHLNVSGGMKVTAYLGDYITSHYDIPDRRNDKAYAKWHEDLETFDAKKTENLEDEDDLYNVLMLLADKDYSAKIRVREDSVLWQDERVQMLLSNCSAIEFVSGEPLYFYDGDVNHLEDYLSCYEEDEWAQEPDLHIFVFDEKTGEFLFSDFFLCEDDGDVRKLN